MKITLDVDCTPEEARTFLGLPDLTAVNAAITRELERRTAENLDSLADPKAFWERALTTGVGNLDAFQSLFAQAARSGSREDG